MTWRKNACNAAGPRRMESARACIGGFVQSLVLACVLLLPGCDKVDLEWSEEVLLADGRMVIVERTAQGRKYSELGGPSGLKQPFMTVKVIRAPDNIKAPPEWREPYVPALLDYRASDKAWSMLATWYDCETWYEMGRPVPPYIEYQSIDGSPWRRVPLEDGFIDRETNLLTGPRMDGEPNLVELADKQLRQLSAARKYQRILPKWGRAEDNFCDLK